ncbi:MAG TPA: TolC family protein [Burkholderiales bacterium]|nr:TolC family protein [Burkholderiales bacterium]
MSRCASPISRRGAAAMLAIALLIAGCASVPREAGFDTVRDTVASRVPYQVKWNRDAAEDAEVRAAVQRMLADALSADEAVQIALLNNRSLQAQYERLGISQADVVQAGLLDNPVISITAMSGAGTEKDYDLVQDFLGVITLAARKKTALAAFEAVKLDVANEALRLAADVKSAYFAVQGDEQALELFRTAAGAAEAAAMLAERQREAGTTHRLNQSMQQGFYAQTLLEVARTEAQLRADREKLNRLMGLYGGETRWKLPGRLPELPAALPQEQALEAWAVERRIDLAALRRESEAIATALQFNLDYRWLSVLGVGYSVTEQAEGGTIKGPQLEFGVPLFDRGQARIARLQSELRRSEQALYAAAVNARSEVREARDLLAAAYEQARFLRDTMLPLQQSIVNETLLRYNGMLLGVYDLLLAKQNQLNAARDFVRASRDFWVAYAQLERAAGGGLPPEFPHPAASTAPAAQSSPGTPAADQPHPSDGDH